MKELRDGRNKSLPPHLRDGRNLEMKDQSKQRQQRKIYREMARRRAGSKHIQERERA